jgi:hypothetical protein
MLRSEPARDADSVGKAESSSFSFHLIEYQQHHRKRMGRGARIDRGALPSGGERHSRPERFA